MGSLSKVFAVRMKKAWVLSYPLSAQRRLWSDWADAQADLSLRWAHIPLCWFCREAAHLCNVRTTVRLLLVMCMPTQSKESSTIWATSWQNQQNGYAPSEDPEQPGHSPRLIRVFAVCSMGSLGSKLSSCGQYQTHPIRQKVKFADLKFS